MLCFDPAIRRQIVRFVSSRKPRLHRTPSFSHHSAESDYISWARQWKTIPIPSPPSRKKEEESAFCDNSKEAQCRPPHARFIKRPSWRGTIPPAPADGATPRPLLLNYSSSATPSNFPGSEDPQAANQRHTHLLHHAARCTTLIQASNSLHKVLTLLRSRQVLARNRRAARRTDSPVPHFLCSMLLQNR